MNPQINQTYERIRVDMQDPEGYSIYLRHVKARKDMATALATGKHKEKIGTVLRLAQMGLGVDKIAQGAELPIDKVQEIIKVHGKTAAIT